ncbi:hypothetical protein CPB83DRAFT_737186, partial [Crepidotus variabilis]
WTASKSNEYPSIDFGNRYFTPVTDAPMHTVIPFPCDVDPAGALGAAGKGKFVHTIDNQVKYYERVGAPGPLRYTKAVPSIVRVGDIVEAQVSFVVVNLSRGRFKMFPTLRSVALLNDTPLVV